MKLNEFRMSTRNGRSELLAKSNAYRAKILVFVAVGLFMEKI